MELLSEEWVQFLLEDLEIAETQEELQEIQKRIEALTLEELDVGVIKTLAKELQDVIVTLAKEFDKIPKKVFEDVQEACGDDFDLEEGYDSVIDSIEAYALSNGFLPPILLTAYNKALLVAGRGHYIMCRSQGEAEKAEQEKKRNENEEMKRLREKEYGYKIIRKVRACGV